MPDKLYVLTQFEIYGRHSRAKARSLRRNSDKLTIRAHEDASTGYSRRCNEPAVELVARQHLRRPSWLEHDRLTRLAEEVHPSIRSDRRSAVNAADTILPDALAGLCVDARSNPLLRDVKQKAVIVDQ